jgi:hypothetical protein
MENGTLANPVNHVAQAYQARTQQFDEQTRQKDNDMLKVFEFAGDGRLDEAKFYAQSKGLEADVPPQVYENADFAKGLTLAGKIYGDDPVAAEKFTTAWTQNKTGDFQGRLAAAQQAAGKPIDPNDREYQRKIAFEMWKLKNVPNKDGGFTLAPGQTRYDHQSQPGDACRTWGQCARAGLPRGSGSRMPPGGRRPPGEGRIAPSLTAGGDRSRRRGPPEAGGSYCQTGTVVFA